MSSNRQRSLDGRPKCPNHGCPLEIDKKDAFKTKGTSPCPVSGALFAWTQEVETEKNEILKDKFGNILPVKTFVVEGEESEPKEIW